MKPASSIRLRWIDAPAQSGVHYMEGCAVHYLRGVNLAASCFSFNVRWQCDTLRRTGGEIVWSVDLLQLADRPAVVTASPAFTTCCTASPALSAPLQWCALTTDILHIFAAAVRS